MGRAFLLLALGCLLGAVVHSQETAPSVQFKEAETTADGVAFEPEFAVNWERVARANFHGFNIDHPDRAQIRAHFFEPGSDASFEYEAVLPAANMGSFYYLLTEAGVVPLIADKLKGAVIYPTDAEANQVGMPTFIGKISAHGAPQHKITDAGFVIVAKNAWTFQTLEVAIVQSEDATGIARKKIDDKHMGYFYNDGQAHRALLAQHAAKYPGVKKAYLLNISGAADRYLFLRWIADTECAEGCCENSYSLVRVGKEVTVVAGNSYGCDV